MYQPPRQAPNGRGMGKATADQPQNGPTTAPDPKLPSAAALHITHHIIVLHITNKHRMGWQPDAERDVDQHHSTTRLGALPIQSQSVGPTKRVANIPTIPIRRRSINNTQIQCGAGKVSAAQTKHSERQIIHPPHCKLNHAPHTSPCLVELLVDLLHRMFAGACTRFVAPWSTAKLFYILLAIGVLPPTPAALPYTNLLSKLGLGSSTRSSAYQS